MNDPVNQNPPPPPGPPGEPPGGPPQGGPPQGGPPQGGPPAGGPPPAAPPPGGPPARPGLPWERSKDVGSLVETAKLLITSPGRAYAEAREKGDYGSPILFAVIFLVIGTIFQQLWQLLFGAGMWAGMMESMGDLPPEFRDAMMQSAATGPIALVISVILAPVLGLIVLFIWTALVHLALQLFGGLQDSTAGFEGSFRALAYGEVAYLALLVPFVGQLIYFIWFIVLQVLGLSTLHRTSQGKALAAVLVPIVVCCCLFIGVFVAFGAAIAAMVGAAGN